ncbi:MAG: alpha/beta hydrolase, partial [Burkholderiaceae bacterium]
QHMGTRSAGMAPFSPEALAAYQRHLAEPARVHAMCEDYRASANIDMALDRADRDAGVGIRCPMMALWGEHGIIGKMFDPLAEWRRVSRSSVTGKSLACGHYVPEEVPEALLGELLPFLAAGSNES